MLQRILIWDTVIKTLLGENTDPSIWLETGPFTLLEALALGVEVWGSETIGQMRLLKAYGRVVQPNTVETWQRALGDMFDQYAAGRHYNPDPNVFTIRNMEDVAVEMAEVYVRLELV